MPLKRSNKIQKIKYTLHDEDQTLVAFFFFKKKIILCTLHDEGLMSNEVHAMEVFFF